ncbi:MAG: diphthine--ammonia ligase [Anaerolineaceae bacterium]
MQKVLFSWSTGKDSALALYEMQKRKDIEIVALITTVTDDYERVSMHGVRRVLLRQQADAIGLPLREIGISKNASNDEYENKMQQLLVAAQSEGVTLVVFGDIFLEDLRKYREEKLAQLGMQAIFPLWKRDSLALAGEMIRLGFKAIVTCVDTHVLGQEFSGREVDQHFLQDLPEKIDPCGENGEFHTFAYAGPIFHHSIAFEIGEKVLRDNRFYYCDLLPI